MSVQLIVSYQHVISSYTCTYTHLHKAPAFRVQLVLQHGSIALHRARLALLPQSHSSPSSRSPLPHIDGDAIEEAIDSDNVEIHCTIRSPSSPNNQGACKIQTTAAVLPIIKLTLPYTSCIVTRRQPKCGSKPKQADCKANTTSTSWNVRRKPN